MQRGKAFLALGCRRKPQPNCLHIGVLRAEVTKDRPRLVQLASLNMRDCLVQTAAEICLTHAIPRWWVGLHPLDCILLTHLTPLDLFPLCFGMS